MCVCSCPMCLALSLYIALIPHIGRLVGGWSGELLLVYEALLSTPGQSRGHQEPIGSPESLLLDSQGSQ